jgi:hypothetical protein
VINELARSIWPKSRGIAVISLDVAVHRCSFSP